MKKVYSGWASECPYGFVALDDDKTRDYPDSLAEKVIADWKKGDVVAVRYYVSDAPMTEDEAVARLVATMYGGEMDANYVLDAYSEWTVLEWEEGLKVGGHDLAQELRTHVGKYVVLVIEANGAAETLAAKRLAEFIRSRPAGVTIHDLKANGLTTWGLDRLLKLGHVRAEQVREPERGPRAYHWLWTADTGCDGNCATCDRPNAAGQGRETYPAPAGSQKD